MPTFIPILLSTLGKVGLSALLATMSAFMTEKRMRKYFVLSSRYLAKQYSDSPWIHQVAADLERDWEAEFKEDI